MPLVLPFPALADGAVASADQLQQNFDATRDKFDRGIIQAEIDDGWFVATIGWDDFFDVGINATRDLMRFRPDSAWIPIVFRIFVEQNNLPGGETIDVRIVRETGPVTVNTIQLTNGSAAGTWFEDTTFVEDPLVAGASHVIDLVHSNPGGGSIVRLRVEFEYKWRIAAQ